MLPYLLLTVDPVFTFIVILFPFMSIVTWHGFSLSVFSSIQIVLQTLYLLIPSDLYICHTPSLYLMALLYFDPRPGPKMLFQGDTPEGSDTFQWPVIERDHVGGLRLMIWDKVKVPLCHYSDAPEESNLWTSWQLFPLDDD